MRFAIELKTARGVGNQKPVVGYLGEFESKTQIDHDTGGPLVVTGVHRVDIHNDAQVPFYGTRDEARRALRSMSDKFFDMYEAEIVQLEE